MPEKHPDAKTKSKNFFEICSKFFKVHFFCPLFATIDPYDLDIENERSKTEASKKPTPGSLKRSTIFPDKRGGLKDYP